MSEDNEEFIDLDPMVEPEEEPEPEVPKKKWWQYITTFFGMLWLNSFGKLDAAKAVRINAAFGSFLMVVLISAGLPLAVVLYNSFEIITATFLISTWEAFAVLSGVVVITIWGSTDKLNADDQSIINSVKSAVEAEMDKYVHGSLEVYIGKAIEQTLATIANGIKEGTSPIESLNGGG